MGYGQWNGVVYRGHWVECGGGVGVFEVLGGWLVGWLGVIGVISDDAVVLSCCSAVVVVGLCLLDVCSLSFCSCSIGFLHCCLDVW